MRDQIKYMNRHGARRDEAHGTCIDLYTPERVAEMLGVSKTKVYRMIRAGQLEAVNLGRMYRITHAAYMRMLERLTVSV